MGEGKAERNRVREEKESTHTQRTESARNTEERVSVLVQTTYNV